MRSKYVHLIFIALIMPVILVGDTINSLDAGRNLLGNVEVLYTFDLYSLFSKTGDSRFREFMDVDGCGQPELVCNIGRSPDFACIRPGDKTAWRTTCSNIKGKTAYSPKVKNGVLYFGQAENKIYAIRLSDGVELWERNVAGLQIVNLGDQGVFVGGSDGIHYLNFSNGSELSNWPNDFICNYGQTCGVGDLDGDGHDEIVASNRSGFSPENCSYRLIDHNGSTIWTKNTKCDHIDLITMADIDPDRKGVEILLVVDDDGSTGSNKEGDEIILVNASDGKQIRRWIHPDGFAMIRATAADVRSDLPGLEIVYAIEGKGEVGLLDHDFNFLWNLKNLNQGPHSTSIINIGDVNGDGHKELLTNRKEGNEAYDLGFYVIDCYGKILGEFILGGYPDVISSRNKIGAPIEMFDVNADGRDEFLIENMNSDSEDGHCIIKVIGWENR